MIGDAMASDHEAAARLQDRFRGMLLGLALGDAVGAAVQHRRPGTFSRVADLLGGGPYDLPRGAWSDDAATALHCADSLTLHGRLDSTDLWERWASWRSDGVGSATGQCLGITAPMAAALSRPPGKTESAAQDAEPLPRVAVAAAFALSDLALAEEWAVGIAALTHPSPRVADVSAAYARLIGAAIQGVSRDALISSGPPPIVDRHASPTGDVERLVAGGWRDADNPVMQGGSSGDALAVLGLVYAVISSTQSYKDAVLKAINAGGHADLTGATVGALAGALYGVKGLPSTWLTALFGRIDIEAQADRLLVASLTRLLDETPQETA